MSDVQGLCLRSLEALDLTVSGLPDDWWQAPTPCRDWTVRDLLGHLTAEALWAPHLLRGETLEEVGDRYEGDVLGDDPRASWHAASASERAAVSAPDALDATVHTSMGELPAEEYLWQRLTDLVVHRWDLARATGGDETMDPEAAEALYERWEPQAGSLAASGLFAEPQPAPEGADVPTRLLALLGRRP